MAHTISFRRPDLRYVLSRMYVPEDSDVAAQVRRLLDLGYQIVEVTPPLDGYPPNPHPPKLSVVDDPPPRFRRLVP